MDAIKQKIYKEYEAHLCIRALAKETVKIYSKEARDFLEFIDDIKDVNRIQVMEYLKQYSEIAPNSKNLHATALKSFFTYMDKNGFYAFKNLKVPYVKSVAKLPNIISQETLLKKLSMLEMIAHFYNKWQDKRDYALIILLYSTGMRISEALIFQMTDIEDGFVRIENGKGSKDRYVPIAEKAIKALNEYVKVRPVNNEKSLFISNNKNALNRSKVYNIIMRKMGMNPHSLRHHFATHLIQGGADVYIVSEFLGHAHLQTTQIYTHIQKESLATTVNNCHPMAHNNKEVSYE